jgi:hypothetical protein
MTVVCNYSSAEFMQGFPVISASRGLPVGVLDHAAEPLLAADLAGLDRPGVVGCRRMWRINPNPILSRLVAVLAAFVAVCSMGGVSIALGQAGGAMQAAASQVAMNAEEPLDGSAAPATLESQALESEVIPATVTYLAREYVWGNGDWGVDELLAQYDADRRASWPLQDAGGDVIALCDRGGANGTARVITQIVYDAHGSVIDRDDPYGLAASAGKELRVGHKGLFFDRLDAGISDPVTGAETPRLWPGARLSGYARNRTLHCDFGRWNQPDPNMTGLPVQAALVYHGRDLLSAVQGFDLRGHFVDGTNVYAYLGGAPWTRFDPTGTSMMVEMMGSMGVRGMLAGALIGGIFGGVQGYQNGDIVGGVARGMVVGAVAGGFGGMGAAVAQSAFAASAAGLWASLLSGSTVGGVAGFTGGLAGSAQAQLMDGQAVDWRVAFADAATTSAWGMALGGVGGSLDWMIRSSSPNALAMVSNARIRFGNNANQEYHTFRHTDALGLDRAAVSQAVRTDLLSRQGSLVAGQPFNQTIVVNGVRIQYTAYQLPDGTINVGRFHGVP